MNIKAKDGVMITAATRGIIEQAKAVVIVCHGFGEHAGSYAELAERLESAGYASVIPTQRGHGRLSEDKTRQKKLQGVIPGYESFLDDIGSVTAYVRQKAPDAQLVLYGHSMGGNIAANYLLDRGQADFTCAALESPWFGLKKEVNPITAALARLGGGLSPKLAIINKLATSDITGDTAKAEEIRQDPLYHNRISLRMFTGISAGCSNAIGNAENLSIPLFVALAKYDAIVENEATLAFITSGGRNITAMEYDSRHAIHNDTMREVFYKDLTDWFDKFCT
jgi:alpha-beta hydrolase superfamily lysophospholipase